MAINEKTDLVTARYSRKNYPSIDDNVKQYLIDEFQRIEYTLLSMADADIQTTDKEPSNPRRGTVRFNVLPWNPLSNNSQGLVVYNGTAWVAV
jgi:hypothetical protein